MNDKQEGIVWHFAGVEVDELRQLVRVRGAEVPLPARPRGILLLLLRRHGGIVSDEEIIDEVWPERHGHLGHKSIPNNISIIRQVIGDEAHTLIQTVPRKGYRLAAEVSRQVVALEANQFPQLEIGGAIRQRPGWILREQLGSGGYGEAWLGEDIETKQTRVFKFAYKADKVSSLKREVTISRLLQKALPERSEFVPVVSWNFDVLPYYIESEYSGANLRSWAKSIGGLRAVSLQTRLDLITKIADAVGAAHTVGVLHRDLKPENILITQDGERFKIKICDFGAGRLIDASHVERLSFTAHGLTQGAMDDSTAGTAIYVAPELYAATGSSERSDVFSLGVLLYQFVVGDLSKPIATGWESDVPDQMLRQDIAEATQGDPEQRLGSARHLADRLQRLPERRRDFEIRCSEQEQLAEAKRAMERSRQRRPWVIVSFATLSIGLAATAFFFIKSQHEAVRARQEAATAKRFNDFLLYDILNPSSPIAGGAGNDTLKDAMVRAIPTIGQRFADAPLDEANVDRLFAATLSYYDKEQEALGLYKRAADIYSQRYGVASRDAIEGRVVVGSVLIDMGRTAEGRELLATGLPSLEALGGKPSEALLAGMAAQARLAEYEGRFDESARSYRDLIAFTEHAIQSHDLPESADILSQQRESLILDLVEGGSFDDAEKMGAEMLGTVTSDFGDDGDLTLLLHVLLGGSELGQGKLADAERSLTAACAGLEKEAGQEAPNTMLCKTYLSRLYSESGRQQQAIPLLKAVYDTYSKQFGEASQDTLAVRSELALALLRVGSFSEALPLARASATASSNVELPSADDFLMSRLVYAAALLSARGNNDSTKELDDLAKEAREALNTSHRSDPLYAAYAQLIDAETALAHADGLAATVAERRGMSAAVASKPNFQNSMVQSLVHILEKQPSENSDRSGHG